MDLNMLSRKVRNGEICVEVSIGNYGNSKESEIDYGTSITSPATARFDGCSQFYVSWESNKPLLELLSEWEDIDYRIYTLNQLRHTAAVLTDACDLVKTLLGRKDVPEMEISAVADDVKLALRKFCEVGGGGEVAVHRSGKTHLCWSNLLRPATNRCRTCRRPTLHG